VLRQGETIIGLHLHAAVPSSLFPQFDVIYILAVKKTALEFAHGGRFAALAIFTDGVALRHLLFPRDSGCALRFTLGFALSRGFRAQQCFALGFLDWQIFKKSGSSHTGFGFSDMPGSFDIRQTDFILQKIAGRVDAGGVFFANGASAVLVGVKHQAEPTPFACPASRQSFGIKPHNFILPFRFSLAKLMNPNQD
jgi:hypothetical protein